MADSQEENPNEMGPILEEPETLESPDAGAGTLFQDDFAESALKLNIVESLMKLTVKDLRFHDFMREILLIAMRSVKSEAAAILELNYSNQTIFFRAAVGCASDRVVRFLIPFGQGIVGHVAESKQVLVVSNMNENRHHLKAINDAVDFEAKNMIALPIIVRGKVYGVLELLNRVGESEYTEEDKELLLYFCQMAARAIEIRMMLAWVKKPKAEAA